MTTSTSWTYLWLLIGTLLMVVANGRWIVPVAAWLAPVFLLRFMRTRKPIPGLLGTLVALIAAYVIAWRGLIPLPGVFYYVVAAGLALILWVAYLADRLLVPRVRGFAGTLVFPAAVTSLEYLCTMTSPYASWGSIAYTQYGNLPLTQLVSITGIWGITFLVTWFASVVNWIWDNEFEWVRVHRGVGLFVGAMCVILLFGGLRLVLTAPRDETVRVATLTGTPHTQGLPNSELLDNYVQRIRELAHAGAEIVVLDETGVCATQESESLYLARACDLARQERIHLLVGLCVMNVTHARGRAWNKAVWIDHSGEVAFEHAKSLLLPGESFIPGDGRLRFDDTPHGRITAAICMDLDRPSLVRQAGGGRADILLVPASDWREIDPIHTNMSSFRAIENGVSLVRATNEGLSAAFDGHGRALATVDYFTSGASPLIAEVSTRGVRTAYAVIGDIFAWQCIAGLITLSMWAVRISILTRRCADRLGREEQERSCPIAHSWVAASWCWGFRSIDR